MPKQDTALQEQQLANYQLYEGRRDWGLSSLDFIQDLVHIIDKGNPDGDEPLFKLWPKQKAVLRILQQDRRIVALKARQLGITWLVLADTVHKLIFIPGYDAFALSQTEDPDAYQLVWRIKFILERLPVWLIQPIDRTKDQRKILHWEATMGKVHIHHPDTKDERGRRVLHKDSIFQSFAATERTARGWTGDRLICDEMAKYADADKVFAAALPSINRPDSGQVVLISTNDVGSYFEGIYRKSTVGANNFTRIFLGWDADPRRDEEWYENTKRDLPNPDDMHSEYPATEVEAFTRSTGCFFPELKHEVHIKPVDSFVPDYYLKYASLDYGLDGYAALWFRVDNYGRSRCYRELYMGPNQSKTISEAAKLFKTANDGDKLEQIFAPADLFSRRQETLKSFAETFAENGVYLSLTNNRREPGWQALKGLLAPRPARDEQTGAETMNAILTFDEGACFHLWRCLTTVQRNQKNYNDICDRTPADHELTHLLDAARYYATARIYPSEVSAVQDEDDERYSGYESFFRYGT